MFSRLAVFTTFLVFALVGPAGAATFTSGTGLTLTTTSAGGINQADIYPSPIDVSGLIGPVTDVDVIVPFTDVFNPTLYHFLLVAPDGTAATLMSQAGGGPASESVAVTVRFDQSASQAIPGSGTPLTSAGGQTLLYRPASYWTGSGARYPGINPSTNVESDLNRFIGHGAAGTWRLYATAGYEGSGGQGSSAAVDKWTLDIKTAGDIVPPTFSKPAVSGRTIGFDLSEAASVQFRVERVSKGVKVKSKCLAPKKGRRGKSCSRYTLLPGAIDRAGAAGVNSFAWNGKIGSKKLAPGKYRLTAIAKDAAGNTSSPQTFTVTIKKPKKKR